MISETDINYISFASWFKKKSGIDLNLYKEQQMKRRIQTFIGKNNLDSYKKFIEELNKSREMLAQFMEHITINVTEFFRNPLKWEQLSNVVIPELIEKNHSLRCWSAACSSGEEPYTLAMLLSQEYPSVRASILATDIDQNILDKATKGIYQSSSMNAIPKPMLHTFFKANGKEYHIADEIKRKVRFRLHNLLLNPYEKNLDLIICRNVTIYFTEDAKHEVYKKFSDSLRKGGYLFVGSTEQLPDPAKFGLEHAGNFFYRKL